MILSDRAMRAALRRLACGSELNSGPTISALRKQPVTLTPAAVRYFSERESSPDTIPSLPFGDRRQRFHSATIPMRSPFMVLKLKFAPDDGRSPLPALHLRLRHAQSKPSPQTE